MKVSAVTPSAAASDPLHPDHDRWVKETTLAMEVEHAKRLGLGLRTAENENAHWLKRSEALAREGKPEQVPSKNQRKPGRKTREERLAERPVERKFVRAKSLVTGAQLSPCGRCGTCRRCMRERRVYAMSLKAKEGDLKFIPILWRLGMHAMAARDRTGKYAGMSVRDANRALIRLVEDVCDATVMQMGPWLR